MKRTLVSMGSVMTVVLLTVGAAMSFASSNQTSKQSGPVTIQSWLLARQTPGDLSGTVKACFKLVGAFQDEGGEPTWNEQTYSDVPPNPADLTGKCGDWTPVGGFNLGPTVSTEHPEWSTLYAVHTLAGKKGLIFITFAGHYDLVSTFQGEGTWVITGGTGAYQKVHGEGTFTADASTFPYIRHTEQGVIGR
jgi:hypothetical protein